MEDSILTTTKVALGIDADDDSFDVDITLGLNSAFLALTQLGLGPKGGFVVSSVHDTWNDYFNQCNTTINAVKHYVVMKIKLVFDPPQNSFTVTALKNSIAELEWRMLHEIEINS